MKHLRQSLALALTLAVVGVFGLAFAQTTAGTPITNQATAQYTDANSDTQTAQSNTVTTTVQKVYSLSVVPSTVTPSGTNATVTDPDTTDFDAAPAQTTSAAEGSTLRFPYTVTNETNADVTSIDLTILQGINGTDDQFDFTNVTLLETNAIGSPLASQPGSFSGLQFTEGEIRYFVVDVTVPTGLGLAAGDVGLIDLVAVNNDAVNDGIDVAGQSFDNNNTAQVTVALYRLGLGKNATVSAPNGDGSYDITLDFYIDATKDASDPDIEITNLTLVDDLSNIAGNVTINSVSTPTIESNADNATINVNTSYDGTTDPNILDAAGSSSINTADAPVQIQVVLNIAGPVTTTNQATVSGDDNNGNTITDLSDEGTNPDPDPTQNDPTNIVAENPIISVAKDAVVTNVSDDGQVFDVQITIVLENQGDVDIQQLSVVEDLAAAFAGATSISISTAPPASVTAAPSGGTISLNSTFDGGIGSVSTELIDASQVLVVGDSATIVFTVTVDGPGNYTNSVTASGQGPGNTPTTDDSNPGTTPADIPGGSNNNDPTPINLAGLVLVKSASTPSDGTGNNVNPGEIITYTIEVTNTGASDLTAITVNDVIPTPTEYVAGSATGGDTQTENGTPVTSIDWTINTLVSGTPVTLTFQVTVP